MEFEDLSLVELLKKQNQLTAEFKKRLEKGEYPKLSRETLKVAIDYYNSIEVIPIEDLRKELKLEKNYLLRDELSKIDMWKNRTGRNQHNILKNSEEDVQIISKKALQVKNLENKIISLVSLKGVSYPMASVILMLLNPEEFGVYDVRVSRVLEIWGLSERRLKSSLKDLLKYFEILDMLRNDPELRPISARDIDKALFAIDRLFGGKILE